MVLPDGMKITTREGEVCNNPTDWELPLVSILGESLVDFDQEH